MGFIKVLITNVVADVKAKSDRNLFDPVFFSQRINSYVAEFKSFKKGLPAGEFRVLAEKIENNFVALKVRFGLASNSALFVDVPSLVRWKTALVEVRDNLDVLKKQWAGLRKLAMAAGEKEGSKEFYDSYRAISITLEKCVGALDGFNGLLAKYIRALHAENERKIKKFLGKLNACGSKVAVIFEVLRKDV